MIFQHALINLTTNNPNKKLLTEGNIIVVLC